MAEKAEGARSFAVLLQTIGEGDLNRELSAEMHKLGNILQEESLKREEAVVGKLTMKMAVKVDPRGVAHFIWDVTSTPPKPKRCGAAMFVNKEGNFVYENPRQQALFPREVKGRREEAREVIDVPPTGGREV